MALSNNPMQFVQRFLTEVLPHHARVQSSKVIGFPDGTLRLEGGTDSTKYVTFEVDGLTTATERIVTFPDRALTLGGGAGSRLNVLPSSGNTSLTAAMSGSCMLLDGATIAYALPAVATADIGIYYDFLVTSVATAQTITAQAADLLAGAVWIADFDTANTGSYFKADESDDLIFTLNGTTKGGKIGSFFRFTAISATRWFVQGNAYGDGTLATPFS